MYNKSRRAERRHVEERLCLQFCQMSLSGMGVADVFGWMPVRVRVSLGVYKCKR